MRVLRKEGNCGRNPLARTNGNLYHRFGSSAHACSEIGLKWFLFALHDLGTALGSVSVLDFLGILSCSNTGETGKPELKPFLTILGTRMRATCETAMRGSRHLHKYSVFSSDTSLENASGVCLLGRRCHFLDFPFWPLQIIMAMIVPTIVLPMTEK